MGFTSAEALTLAIAILSLIGIVLLAIPTIRNLRDNPNLEKTQLKVEDKIQQNLKLQREITALNREIAALNREISLLQKEIAGLYLKITELEKIVLELQKEVIHIRRTMEKINTGVSKIPVQ